MTALTTMLRGRQGQLKSQLDAMRAFLQSHRVPTMLEKRVVKDMEHLSKTPNTLIKRQIIDCVPITLAAEVDTHTHTHMHTYTHTHTHTHTHIHTHIHTNVRTHTHTHTHKYAHTHTHAQTSKFQFGRGVHD